MVRRRKYHEIKNDNHSVGADSDISITGVGKSSRFEMNSGVDNPNFVIDVSCLQHIYCVYPEFKLIHLFNRNKKMVAP